MEVPTSRQLVIRSYALQLPRGRLLQRHGLVWACSGWQASGANLVMSSDSQRRGLLMRWLRMQAFPAAWLVWPDQQPAEQSRELAQWGFYPAETLLLMERSTAPSPQQPEAVRVLAAADQQPLSQLYARCHQIPILYAREVADGFWQGQHLHQCCTWVAPGSSGELRAAITACWCHDRALLLWLGTDPAHRGRGWATCLIDVAIDALWRLGIPQVELQAVPRARGLYARCGFQAKQALPLWLTSPALRNAGPTAG